jgi:uncharacterized protein
LNPSKKSTLVDAGPLVATFSRGDVHHAASLSFFAAYRGELVTTWPVVAEACHLLRRAPEERINLLRWIERGALRVHESVAERVSEVIEYMAKYADLPMDLADASVVIAAINLDIRDIASTDSDFEVYRLPNRGRLNNVLASHLS